jgi:transmembrane sensor
VAGRAQRGSPRGLHIMSSVVRFPETHGELTQAATWIARLDRGLRGREREQLRKWLSEDPRNHAAFIETARLWDHLDVLAELAELFPLHEDEVAGRWTSAGRAAVAASVLLGLATALFAFHYVTEHRAIPAAPATLAAHPVAATPDTPFAATYSTAIGEQRTVSLPDHSTIQLNTNTVLSVEYTRTARLLHMTRGEANFQVAKDPARLFTVRVAGFDFNAVGTAFNIRADSAQRARLTVTQGRVRVNRTQPAAAEPGAQDAATPQPGDIAEVEANKEVVVDVSGERIAALAPAQVQAATAWQHGMVAFEATPLDRVIAELGRYSTTRFVLKDAELAHIPVSGYFKIDDTTALVAALEHNFNIDVQASNNVMVLSNRPQP